MSTAALLDAPPKERLLTAADLASLPTSLPSGDVRYELDNGRLIVMAPPGYGHGFRQLLIGHYLKTFGIDKGHGEACAESGIILRRNPDRVVGVDAAFITNASLPVRLSPEGYLETIPELVVELRSKNDTPKEIADKNDEYFDAGVKLVWLVDEESRTVTAHRRSFPPHVFRDVDTLTCEFIPGFAVPVANLFVKA